MGICISVASSEIHNQAENENNHENVIFLGENIISHEVQKPAGSVFSRQGSKGLNQDAGILCQVLYSW